MSLRKKKLPFPVEEYVIDEKRKEVWLRGSMTRSWAKKHLKSEYGYTFLLCSQDFIDRIKAEGLSAVEDTLHHKNRQT